MNRFGILLFSFLLLPASTAFGGYLNFTPPENAPDLLDGLDFRFRMTSNPGAQAQVFYAHNFSFKTSDAKRISGYIGLQSTTYVGKESYALVTIWPEEGQDIDVKPAFETKCSIQKNSAEGSVVTCVITNNHPLAAAMPNGNTYKFSILPTMGTDPQQYSFSITDEVTGRAYPLGTMIFKNVNILGLDSHWPSNFLEYFGKNGDRCETTPYTAYTEEAPVGYTFSGTAYKAYPYKVAVAKEPFDKCLTNLTYNNEHTAVTVEYAFKYFQKAGAGDRNSHGAPHLP